MTQENANQLIRRLNKAPMRALQKITAPPLTMRLLIRNGKITGFTLNGKLYEEKIPTQTANPSGDE